jgi:hypothetical protein
MKCPDCNNGLRGDGSCCDYCGWTLAGGGDDPRLPSGRSRHEIEQAKQQRCTAMVARTVRRADPLHAAAQQLAKSDKGRDALRRVLDWLEASGLSLDGQNQQAILLLLEWAWEGKAGTVREVMHEALGD